MRDRDGAPPAPLRHLDCKEKTMRRKITLLAVLAATQHNAATKATTITVKATEFKFALSKTSAPKGTVNFKVTNKGKVDHDFKINGKKTKLLAPGKSATLTVKFQKTGKFPYLCTVPGHAASGMKGTFTVK
jgi:uncharacterized cupredoxin-like copper-binding protein